MQKWKLIHIFCIKKQYVVSNIVDYFIDGGLGFTRLLECVLWRFIIICYNNTPNSLV